jgi:hypothetical protein
MSDDISNPTERSYDRGWAFGREYSRRKNVYTEDLEALIPSSEVDEGNPDEWLNGAYEALAFLAHGGGVIKP